MQKMMGQHQSYLAAGLGTFSCRNNVQASAAGAAAVGQEIEG